MPRQHIFAAFREIQVAFRLGGVRASNGTSMAGESSSMRTQQPPLTTNKTEIPQETFAGPPPNPSLGSGSGSFTSTIQGSAAVGSMSQASLPQREDPKLPTSSTLAQESTFYSISKYAPVSIDKRMLTMMLYTAHWLPKQAPAPYQLNILTTEVGLVDKVYQICS